MSTCPKCGCTIYKNELSQHDMQQDRNSPANRWEKLKNGIISEIDSIDSDTPGGNREPDWWVEMMEVRRLFNNKKERKP